MSRKYNDARGKNINEPGKIKEGKKKRNKKNEEKVRGKKGEVQEGEEEDYAVIPPNGGWGWVVVVSAFYCNVVVDGIQLTFGVFLKAIATDFNTEYSKVALAGSLMFGVHLLMGPVCAGCNSAFGLRPVTVTGALVCCFGVGISYFASGCWFLYFSFGIIGGMGLGFVYMNSLVITSLYFTTLMPIAIGIVVSGTGIGTMVFAVMGSFLLGVTTWQTSFLIQAALAGSMSVAALAFRPLKPMKVKVSQPSSKTDQEEEPSSSRKRSVFIKTEVNRPGSIISIRTYQSLALNFAAGPENKYGEKNKNRCNFCSCCKARCCRKKKVPEYENILLLVEDPESPEKSYVEKGVISKTEEEEEIELRGPASSTTSHKSVFTKVEYTPEKSRPKCWKSIKQSVTVILDCRLLRSCSFCVFTVSGAVGLAAFLIVFIYEKDRCEELGFSERDSVIFVVTLGGVNVFWRLLLGGIAVLPKVRHWELTICGMVIGGVGTMVSGFNSHIAFQFVFCFLFGLAMACFAVFRMPLIIDLVGIELLENAAGINLLFMGVFCIIFPPIFGLIKEATNSYNVIFVITGCLIVFCALTLIKMKKVDLNKVRKDKDARS